MKKILAIFFISALLMEFITQIVFKADDTVLAIKKWVPKQEKVKSEVGRNIVLERRGKTSINATQSKPAYSVYKFSIHGSVGTGMLAVEVSDSNEMKITHLIVD